jgi:hypothetical protein
VVSYRRFCLTALCRRANSGRRGLGAEHHAGRSRSWSKDNIAWSGKDIASFLEDGQYPDGDYAGDAMADVIHTTTLLAAAT